MSLRNLAEGIILQSIEDLWNEEYRGDSVTFFRNEDFRLCAELAGMDIGDQVELLNLVKRSMGSMKWRKMKRPGQERDGAQQKKTRGKQLQKVLNYS